MSIVLRELFQRYCLTIEDVKPYLSEKYNIQSINDNLVLDDAEASSLIDIIYGRINNDVDIHYEENDDYLEENIDDEFSADDIADCPPKSQLPYTCGRLTCPYCGEIGQTFVDGTAYCRNCKRWYRYS